MMMIVSLLGVLAVTTAVFVAPLSAGVWILRPLDVAAKRFRRPTRFGILDFFGLVFLVQMPMALVQALVPQREPVIFWAFMILGWCVSIAVWSMAVKTFANAGITNVWRRAVLVFYVLPAAYFGTFGSAILAIVLVTSGPATLGRQVFWWMIEALLLAAVFYAGRLTRRLAPATTPSGAGNPFAEPVP